MKSIITLFLMLVILWGRSSSVTYDILIKNGQIIDGTGDKSYVGDIGINADTIVAIGNLPDAKGKVEIDASDLVIAPGFINMLSWAVTSLIEDGRSQRT